MIKEEDIVKTFFDFIVGKMENGKGGLSQLEADLYNLPIMKEILINQKLRELVDEYYKHGIKYCCPDCVFPHDDIIKLLDEAKE